MTDPNPIPRGSVLLIGGPDAGKSNYLFRLWIALQDGRGALTKDGLPSDLTYLRSGAERLLEGKFAGHTSKEVHERVEIPVKSTALGVLARRGILIIPDMPGEQIRAVYRNRQWSRVWEDYFEARCGSLIFVRASSSENVVALDWATCIELYGSVFSSPEEAHPEAGLALAPGTATTATRQSAVELGRTQSEFEAADSTNKTPTQVLLTDWMQFLQRAIAAHADDVVRPRIGIVVTAWDAVPTDQQEAGPRQYLKDNFPLLHQFVETNGDALDLQTFGLSVVSGDLNADADFKKQYEAGNPRDFGFVIHSLRGALQSDADVTLPVAWALGFVDASSH